MPALVLPYGVNDWTLKHMTQTGKAWMKLRRSETLRFPCERKHGGYERSGRDPTAVIFRLQWMTMVSLLRQSAIRALFFWL